MCGIAGFYGTYDIGQLRKMSETIIHRGPDDDSLQLFNDENYQVGLAHRRLSIIDLSIVGRQPMTVRCRSCTDLWLIYNGEIYNYRQLRQELIDKGHYFQSQTDSEILLHLYSEYGSKMLEKLNGIFAFAIYDARKKPGELFIARDGLGVKPLYYADCPTGFIFASEMKAILAANVVKRDLDYTALHYYLTYLWSPGADTALANIKKVEPGQAMLIVNGHIKKSWFYYDVPYNGNYLTDTEKQITQELDEKLTQAVKRQLVADVPVGAFLSGGLDSSAVVAYMRQSEPHKKIDCYTIGFKGGMESEGNPDDIPYAKKVAKHLNVDLHILEQEAEMINLLPKMIYHLDEPQADPAPIHVYLIAKLAREQGTKVLLSGAGGDDIFSGYRRHQALLLEPLWRLMPAFLKQQTARMTNRFINGNSTYKRRLAKLFSVAPLAADERLIHHFQWNTEAIRSSLYSDEFAEQLKGHETEMRFMRSLARIPDEPKPLNRMLYLETKHFLADHNLNYTDKMAMAAGVEVRVPLLDPELVAYAAKIPVGYKLQGRTTKSIFKKTMQRHLPHNIIYRPKAGFGAPLRRWIHHELRPLVEDLLSPQAIQDRGLFNSNNVNALIKKDRDGTVDATYTIFSLLCIEIWCRTFL